MRRQILAIGLVLALAGAFGLSCSSTGNSLIKPPSGAPGTLAVFGGDAPPCSVSSFKVSVTSATLSASSSSGTTSPPVSILSPGQAVTLDFATLMDFSTLMNLIAVPAGKYSQLSLTLSNPQLTVLDFTKTPPAPTLVQAVLTTPTVTINLNPPLTVSSSGAAGLVLDFDLFDSLQTDTNGQITGNVNPVFTAGQTMASAANGLGELETLHGIVTTVTTTSSKTAFSGSIVVEMGGASGPSFLVNVATATVFDGVSGLSTLPTGEYVALDAFVDTQGNIVAKTVAAEQLENSGTAQAAFVGLIVSVTQVNGIASQFTLYIREEDPDVSLSIPTGQLMTVNLSPTTTIQAEATTSNFAQLSVNSSNLGPGQEVVAHGIFKIGTAGLPPILNANAVFLRSQSVRGNFSKTLAVGTDGVTGGFSLTPCSGIFQLKGLDVLTFSGTNFLGVTNLNSLTTAPPLLVKGLLLFEPTLTSAGTVILTPPSIVLVAKQVHQLP